jgi:hypothetical protein
MRGVKKIALLALAGCALLNGCGLAETGAAAAAGGVSAAEQAKQAKETEDKVRRDIEAAQQAADERLKAADQAAE